MFQNRLDSHEIGEKDGRVVYELDQELVWNDGKWLIIVPVGFNTDLASVPRLPIIYGLWGDRAHRGGVLHDYLYRVDCEVFDIESCNVIVSATRSFADDMFYKANKASDYGWHVYWPMWAGVRLGGWTAYHSLFVNSKYSLDKRY